MNQTQFAAYIGMSRSALSEFESGTREPSKDFIMSLSEKGISIDWFLSGKGKPLMPELTMVLKDSKYIISRLKSLPFDEKSFPVKGKDFSSTNPLQETPSGDIVEAGGNSLSSARTGEIPLINQDDERLKRGIIIPFLGDQAVSAGYGTELEDEDRPTHYFRVPAYLGRYPNLAILPVKGDSMDPTLHDGDMVVCDGGGWDGDGIYVIKTSDEAFVKRVVSTSKGYQVISDNQAYPSYGESKEDVAVVGKVRAAFIAIPGKRGGI